jgi:hypothetical protein
MRLCTRRQHEFHNFISVPHVSFHCPCSFWHDESHCLFSRPVRIRRRNKRRRVFALTRVAGGGITALARLCKYDLASTAAAAGGAAKSEESLSSPCSASTRRLRLDRLPASWSEGEKPLLEAAAAAAAAAARVCLSRSWALGVSSCVSIGVIRSSSDVCVRSVAS